VARARSIAPHPGSKHHVVTEGAGIPSDLSRHGVLPGQVEPSARLIWLLEKAGWIDDVRWPKPQRFAALRLP
jgi:hypothetical protein